MEVLVGFGRVFAGGARGVGRGTWRVEIEVATLWARMISRCFDG